MIPEGGVLYPNDDQNRDIRVSRKSIRHSLDHADLYKIQAAANAEGIVKNAVKLGEIPVATDEIGKTNSVSVFYCPVRIDRKLYSARLVVKQYINQEGDVLDDLALYDMNVHNKKTVPSVSNVAGSPGVYIDETASAYKVKDLIFDSQEEDKKLAGVQNTLFRYSPEEAEESAVRFRKVEDPAKIEELENGPKVKVYRSMQEIDGQLYPPMSEHNSSDSCLISCMMTVFDQTIIVSSSLVSQ